ncbi:MAG: galactokinase [Blastococcus sp.]|nr:galactokinase [Blastococcus sp.]
MTDDDRRAAELRTAFQHAFGGPPDLVVRSPGRVNLIGEHTDYNDGFSLPIALDLGTDVAVRRRPDGMLRTVARRMEASDIRPVDALRPTEGPEWARYVAGTAALLREHLGSLPGADLLIDGDLPIGAGLSSSASLELGVLVALLGLTEASVDRTELARLGQRVENEVIGVRSGIMDQLAIACGAAGAALLIDCRTLTTEVVPLPAGIGILVLDSAVPRTLAGSAYNIRRAECDAALRRLQVLAPHLRALRDVPSGLLAEHGSGLSDVELRRARHVVSENARVRAGATALAAGDAATFGRLMTDSHASLRDDYSVSGPELDILVDVALATPGVLGARLTGAGFGGCAVALVTSDAAERAAATIPARYRNATGRPGTASVAVASRGTHVSWSARHR